MFDMLRFATMDYELECMVKERDYNTWDWIRKFWGRDVNPRAYQVDPIGFTDNLNNQLARDEADPWWTRKNFVPFTEAWNKTAAERPLVPGSYLNESELSPLRSVLANGLRDLVKTTNSSVDDNNATDRSADEIPWCIRLRWSAEIIGMVAELADQKTLLCDIQPAFFFVEKANLGMRLHKGYLAVQYGAQRYHSKSVCFSDLQCHACFRQAAETWLPNGKCDMKRGQCVGFDAMSQAKVVIRSIISLLLPSGWSSLPSESSDGVQQELEERVAWIMEEIFDFADYIGGNSTSEKLHESVRALQVLLEQEDCKECLEAQAWVYNLATIAPSAATSLSSARKMLPQQ
mmetsp:Transcript_38805/g.109793  ORF Transcript_38805/g.109793 Transcript_38805/m.109793 type:complete len:346 (-) Transcript_38805:281-1318(-)